MAMLNNQMVILSIRGWPWRLCHDGPDGYASWKHAVGFQKLNAVTPRIHHPQMVGLSSLLLAFHGFSKSNWILKRITMQKQPNLVAFSHQSRHVSTASEALKTTSPNLNDRLFWAFKSTATISFATKFS